MWIWAAGEQDRGQTLLLRDGGVQEADSSPPEWSILLLVAPLWQLLRVICQRSEVKAADVLVVLPAGFQLNLLGDGGALGRVCCCDASFILARGGQWQLLKENTHTHTLQNGCQHFKMAARLTRKWTSLHAYVCMCTYTHTHTHRKARGMGLVCDGLKMLKACICLSKCVCVFVGESVCVCECVFECVCL